MAGSEHTRRDLFAGGTLAGAAGLGAILAAGPGAANAAPAMSAQEAANLKLVNDFCAVWPTSDLDRVMGFFSDQPAYRQTETQAPAVGRQAVIEKINGLMKVAAKFEVHDSWARGPMVVNERSDYFSSGRLKLWRGVGVFLVQNGKIVEWYDYTIERQLA